MKKNKFSLIKICLIILLIFIIYINYRFIIYEEQPSNIIILNLIISLILLNGRRSN